MEEAPAAGLGRCLNHKVDNDSQQFTDTAEWEGQWRQLYLSMIHM